MPHLLEDPLFGRVRLLEISLRVLYGADYRRESISKIRVLLEKCQKLLVAEFRRRHLLSLHRFVDSTAYSASLWIAPLVFGLVALTVDQILRVTKFRPGARLSLDPTPLNE
jgi:hypothetical protein